jgi:phosphoesterase RecJ-like protein
LLLLNWSINFKIILTCLSSDLDDAILPIISFCSSSANFSKALITRAALICLSKEEQGKFRYVKGDTEGFVNIPLQMKGICFSVFLREDTEKDMIKVSLRSVGAFPCNQVAAEFFNGGGHLNASGGEFYGTMDEAVDLFKQALVKYESLLLKN